LFFFNQNEDSPPSGICDLSRFWPSCLGPLTLFLPQKIWISNLLIFSVHDALCALNLISTSLSLTSRFYIPTTMIVTTGEFVLHKYIIFTVNTTSMKWYLYIDFNKRYVPSFFSGVCITQNDPYFIWHFKIIKTFSFHCFFNDLGKQTNHQFSELFNWCLMILVPAPYVAPVVLLGVMTKVNLMSTR
jgi:hypothetical protein